MCVRSAPPAVLSRVWDAEAVCKGVGLAATAWLLPGDGGSEPRDPGVSMPGLLLKIHLPFQSLRWLSSPLGWEDTRPQGIPSSTMPDGGAFRPRSLKWEEVLWPCEEGRNVSEH